MFRRVSLVLALFSLAVFMFVSPVAAQGGHRPGGPGGGSGGGPGNGGGGGGGGKPTTGTSDTGDLFGDLIHIQRDDTTGVPILAKRWVELPRELQGYGWGYCPIALDANGAEIGFAPLSCDIDPAADPVEVDYFGRLSVARSMERNLRVHFDEVIFNIKAAEVVTLDEAGRLKMGTGCTAAGGTDTCSTWAVIDSPNENLALYHRLMKYGHIQTDPLEADLWTHGDPALGTVYHPALDATDWGKFRNHAKANLLLDEGDPARCFTNGNFTRACAASTTLGTDDFVVAASFLGGAAGKENIITVDLVQYMNRILGITLDTSDAKTGGTTPTVLTLPAKVRDCWPVGQPTPEPPAEDETPVEPVYLPVDQCSTSDATPALENYTNFPVVMEQFVDFGAANYLRSLWFDTRTVSIIKPTDLTTATPMFYAVTASYPLTGWLEDRNPGMASGVDVAAFVYAASDSLRAIQFIHNYEVPAVLWYFEGTGPIIP